jgi:hypothetical protein
VAKLELFESGETNDPPSEWDARSTCSPRTSMSVMVQASAARPRLIAASKEVAEAACRYPDAIVKHWKPCGPLCYSSVHSQHWTATLLTLGGFTSWLKML